MPKIVLNLATSVRVDLLDVGLDTSLLLQQLLVMAIFLLGLSVLLARKLNDSTLCRHVAAQ